MTRSRGAASTIARAFERAVEEAVMAGAGHPDLREWRQECLNVARERLIRRLTDDPRPVRMPPQPEIDYDR